MFSTRCPCQILMKGYIYFFVHPVHLIAFYFLRKLKKKDSVISLVILIQMYEINSQV